jgi:hypothetical protein
MHAAGDQNARHRLRKPCSTAAAASQHQGRSTTWHAIYAALTHAPWRPRAQEDPAPALVDKTANMAEGGRDPSTKMLRSGFGKQIKSVSRSNPSWGFGTSMRESSTKVGTAAGAALPAGAASRRPRPSPDGCESCATNACLDTLSDDGPHRCSAAAIHLGRACAGQRRQQLPGAGLQDLRESTHCHRPPHMCHLPTHTAHAALPWRRPSTQPHARLPPRTLQSSVGPQPESNTGSSPVVGFSTSSRLPKNQKNWVPGPGQLRRCDWLAAGVRWLHVLA